MIPLLVSPCVGTTTTHPAQHSHKSQSKTHNSHSTLPSTKVHQPPPPPPAPRWKKKTINATGLDPLAITRPRVIPVGIAASWGPSSGTRRAPAGYIPPRTSSHPRRRPPRAAPDAPASSTREDEDDSAGTGTSRGLAEPPSLARLRTRSSGGIIIYIDLWERYDDLELAGAGVSPVGKRLQCVWPAFPCRLGNSRGLFRRPGSMELVG